MLFKALYNVELNICHKVLIRGFSSKSPWDIITGVCVERLPVISPPLNEIQKRYAKMLYIMEKEKSLKSDHEIRRENDKVQAELLKKEGADVDVEAISKITAQDFEDASNEEFSKFKFADIITEADKTGDRSSLERQLQRHLVLVTPLKLGNDLKTLFPQAKWKEGETLRQTAERTVQEQCGPGLKIKFLSNAPCGFYKYKYPTEIDGKMGAKVFFYYANYNSGNSKTKSNWLTRQELSETLPEKYNKSVQEFLFEESY